MLRCPVCGNEIPDREVAISPFVDHQGVSLPDGRTLLWRNVWESPPYFGTICGNCFEKMRGEFFDEDE